MKMTLRNSDLQRIELTIRIPPLFRLRIWAGTKVMVLGAKITGMLVKVKSEAME